MASVKETPSETTENSDLSAIQQLVFSVGRLKFSLRSLEAMHLQSALLSQKAIETPENLKPMESNGVLENIMSEISSNKSDTVNEDTDTLKKEDSVSIEDLELVQKKLKEEFEKRRTHFITKFSEKCSNNETFLKYL